MEPARRLRAASPVFCRRRGHGALAHRLDYCSRSPVCRRRFKESGGQEAQALGRSRGGFPTKMHIAVEALGNPLRLLLTAGQRHDSPQAAALIDGFEPQVLIADKGYDSDPLIESVTVKGILA